MHIPASHGRLEALVKNPADPARGAAVVCHPHPLHGGTMHTKAVYRAARALNDAGLVALRFNFRGVGASTGSYDEGIAERADLEAALDWLEAEYPELPLLAGGFSFGSLVGLSVGVDDERVVSVFGFGLPVDMNRYDYSFLAESDKPVLVVQGENDEFGSGDRVSKLLAPLGVHITLARIPGSDHYFTDRLDELGATVRRYYASGPGSRFLVLI
jgi:alpha/beta superfamily hydrolase